MLIRQKFRLRGVVKVDILDTIIDGLVLLNERETMFPNFALTILLRLMAFNSLRKVYR